MKRTDVSGSGYTKIYGRKLLTSSIWREDTETKIIWITLLAMANEDGIVDCWIPGVSAMSGIDMNKTEEVLTRLTEPDKYSRTTANEGRRIEYTDVNGTNCIRILNHELYRGFQSKKQAKDAERQRKRRERDKRDMSQVSRDVTVTSRDIALNTNTNTNTNLCLTTNVVKQINPQIKSDVQKVFNAWKSAFRPASRLTDSRKAVIQTRLKSFSADDLVLAIEHLAHDPWRHEQASRNELTAVLRNDDKVEGLINDAKNNSKTQSRKQKIPGFRDAADYEHLHEQ